MFIVEVNTSLMDHCSVKKLTKENKQILIQLNVIWVPKQTNLLQLKKKKKSSLTNAFKHLLTEQIFSFYWLNITFEGEKEWKENLSLSLSLSNEVDKANSRKWLNIILVETCFGVSALYTLDLIQCEYVSNHRREVDQASSRKMIKHYLHWNTFCI